MVSKRRRFTREFKIEAVGLATSSDHTVPEAAQDLEIHPNKLYRWVHYGENSQEAFPAGQAVLKLKNPRSAQARESASEDGLKAKTKRRFKATTDSTQFTGCAEPVEPGLPADETQ